MINDIIDGLIIPLTPIAADKTAEPQFRKLKEEQLPLYLW